MDWIELARSFRQSRVPITGPVIDCFLMSLSWWSIASDDLIALANHSNGYNLSAPDRKVQMLEEHFFQCPYCWEEISVLLDLSAGSQSYVEDCEVCCNPISISYDSHGAELMSFSADASQ